MDDPFSRMHDPMKRADRYQKVAGEYCDLARTASSPFLRAYYQSTAEEYRVRGTGTVEGLRTCGAAGDGR